MNTQGYTTNGIQISVASYANGNLTGYAGSGYFYDVENRLKQASPARAGSVLYGYDSTNHRVYKGAYNGSTNSAEKIYIFPDKH